MHGHRKTVEINREPGDCHELTFSRYRRMPLLTNDDWRLLLAGKLDTAISSRSSRRIAYVFMPEHVHRLIQPTTHNANRISVFVHLLKTRFSRQIKKHPEIVNSPILKRLTVQERPGKTCFRFWQKGGGYDRNLRSERAILAAINDIHEDPVRRGLCSRAIDWRWSRAHHFCQDADTLKTPENDQQSTARAGIGTTGLR
jgi:putative transposase